MTTTPTPTPPGRAARIHHWTSRILRYIMLVAFVAALYEHQWLNALTIAAIFIITLLPAALSRRFNVFIPPEFEILAILFIFASLFLGEIGDYYEKYWWWDTLLHTFSGLLLGILGFLLVYVLNRQPRINLHMTPGFVAFFAFTFAVAIGALWEIFEFVMDASFGLNMQKSGLVDTMWDLIVDTLGAALISLFGYFYTNQPTPSFIEKWIHKFIDTNPRLFRSHNT